VTGIVITGYASLDHVIVLDGAVRPGVTTTIVDRPEAAWPRLGGGPAYVARAVRAAYGGSVAPISWIGRDPPGETYLAELARYGISAEGMAIVEGVRTPFAILAYDPNGDCACLYDPGMPEVTGLTEKQRALAKGAGWICVTIGPKTVTEEILTSVREDQKLAWIVKNDPRALSAEQVARLTRRADLIFCNSRERPLIEGAREAGAGRRPGQLTIETRGRQGAALERDGETRLVPAEPFKVIDPTGAGDSFAGGVLAAILKGETDLEALGRAGHAAARALLRERAKETS
jgi:ribokinase